MANMKNSHAVFEDPVEDFVWIANEWHNMNARSPDYLLCRFRVFGDSRNDSPDTRFEGDGNGIPEYQAAGGCLAQVGSRAVGVFDLHARRKLRKAASTCWSVATPLLSASSIA